LKGDLNILQDLALQHLMADENDEAMDTEAERMKYTILAGNIELYKEIFSDEEDEENIEWITPKSAEDIEAILQDYQQVQIESIPAD
jgi:hypothetical protein